MTMPEKPAAAPGEPIVAYKALLRDVIDRRPSGTRRRLAEALGKNPSFISQITNPAYPTPIPARDVETILELCHFSADERARFMETYTQAHPRRTPPGARHQTGRSLTLSVPEFGNSAKNAEFDKAIHDFMTQLTRLMDPT